MIEKHFVISRASILWRINEKLIRGKSKASVNILVEFSTFIANQVLKFGSFICYATELFSFASIF